MCLPCPDTELSYWLPLVASKAAKPIEAQHNTSVILFQSNRFLWEAKPLNSPWHKNVL